MFLLMFFHTQPTLIPPRQSPLSGLFQPLLVLEDLRVSISAGNTIDAGGTCHPTSTSAHTQVHTHAHTTTHTNTHTHTLFSVAKRKKERVLKQKLLKGYRRDKNINVLAILECP